MKPWHEQDAFWETMAGEMFTAAQWQQAVIDVDQFLALVPLPAAARILDLCCGPGRHSLELGRRGFAVTGVDRTQSYLAAARVKAEQEHLDGVEFQVGDMRTYRQPESFDLVLNLSTSFGYFEDPAEDKLVLQNMYASLRQGGKVVIDVLGKEVLARKFGPRDWSEEGNVLFLQQRTISKDWSWIEDRWIRIHGSQRS